MFDVKHYVWEEDGRKYSCWKITTPSGSMTTGDGGYAEFCKIFHEELENLNSKDIYSYMKESGGKEDGLHSQLKNNKSKNAPQKLTKKRIEEIIENLFNK